MQATIYVLVRQEIYANTKKTENEKYIRNESKIHLKRKLLRSVYSFSFCLGIHVEICL